jgi:hypothetical protein
MLLLIVSDAVIGRKQYVIARLFGYLEKLAVGQPVPAHLPGSSKRVFPQRFRNRNWSLLVEENQHQPVMEEDSRLRAANSNTACTCSRVSPS